MMRPEQSDQGPQRRRRHDRVGGVVEEPDRQEPEHQRARLAPEPDVLVEHVEQCDERGGEQRAHGTQYYPIRGPGVYRNAGAITIAARTDILAPYGLRTGIVAASTDRVARRARHWTPRTRDRGLALRSRPPAPRSGSTSRRRLGWDPRTEVGDLRRPEAVRRVRGRVAARRSGAALDAQGAGGHSPSTSSRPAARRAFRRPASSSNDFRIDYEMFSETLPDEYFPKGSNWLMLGPSGPRRLRLAVEHLASIAAAASASASISIRAGWSSSSRRAGWSTSQAYKDHVIDQAVTILQAGHDIKCMFTTPKLLESLALRLEDDGHDRSRRWASPASSPAAPSSRRSGTASRTKSCSTARYMTPTYGNTLMGLAASAPSGPANDYKITYYAPQPRAVIEVVDFDDANKVVDYGQTGPREADDADEGVLRSRIPGARRRRARAAATRSIRGTASAACGRSASSPRRRRSACIEREVSDHPVTWKRARRIPGVCAGASPTRALESDEVVHFSTGEPIAKVSRANGGLIQRDMRKAPRARDALREIPDRRADRDGEQGGRALHERRRCRWATARRRPTSSSQRSRRARACRSTCAAPT